MYKYIITFIIVFGISFSISAQKQKNTKKGPSKIEVSGTITDNEGKPIYGAEVSCQEGRVFTFTNKSGAFTIKVSANDKIMIESEGFKVSVIDPNISDKPIVLIRESFLESGSDIVNLPFGYSTYKKNVVSSAVSINPQRLAKVDNSQYFYDAILGRIPGMIGNQSIHGMENAVFVVDGVAGRDVSNLNLEEIEQVTVLKDANAAVLYGVQAQNGVILITTKRGTANKSKMTFSAETGFGFAKELPKYLNAADYMTYFNYGRKNDGLSPMYDSTTIANTRNGSNPYKYPDVNYYSKTFLNEFRPFKRFFGEFSGGNDNTQYYLNLGWSNTGTLLNLGEGANESTNQFNLRANVDFRINDFITSNLDVVTVLDFQNGPNTDFWNLASTLRPNAYPLLIPVADIQNSSDVASAKRFNKDYILGGTAINPSDNMYGEMYMAGYSKPNSRTAQINQGFRFDLNKLVKGLTLNTNISFDLYNAYTNSTNNTYAIYEPSWLKKIDGSDSLVVKKIGTDVQTGNQSIPQTSVSFTRRVGANAVLNYARNFNDMHQINGSVIAYINTFEQNDMLLDMYYPHLGMQLNYGFKEKYLVDFSGSLVNSVKLKEGNRTQFSPTIGAAWIVSGENFLKENKSIDFLKLRASTGVIKSDMNIATYYIYENTFGTSTAFPWGDGGRTANSTIFNNLENTMINYEKRHNINIGFEASLFNKSLWLEGNVFQNRFSDLVGKMVNLYPDYLGGFNPTVNYGEELYRGFDLGLNFKKNIGALEIIFGGNITADKSEVIKKDELYFDAYQNRVGKRVDAIFGLKSDGLYKESDFTDPNAGILKPELPVPAFGTVKPGDIKYINQNADKIIDAKDEVMIGNSAPDLYFGLNLTLSYKGISLFALVTGQNGAERNLNNDYYWVRGNTMKYSEQILGGWYVDMTDEQKAAATYPRITSTNSTNNFRQSDYWLVDNDFVNIQRIQLTYDLPKSVISRIGVKGLNFYVRGANLLTISKSAKIRDLNIGTQPQFRNFSAGLRANF